MSQGQLHKTQEVVDTPTDFQEQEYPNSSMPAPVQSHDASTMGQQQEEPPVEATPMSEGNKPQGHAVTYGDVFPAVAAEEGPLAGEAITTEDASLMQAAEAMAFGRTPKDGAASVMQAAAAKNVQGGWVKKDAHSRVSEYGLSVTETSVPGAVMDIEYVGGQPVAASARPAPTDPAIAALDAVTIGEALEAVAMGAGDKPIEDSDARAIESAERRATGVSMPMKGGVGATAQSAAQWNHRTDEAGQTTLADVLMDASSDLPADKVVTYEDAYRVLQAELRGRNVDDLYPGGVGATLAAAAEMNAKSGLIPPPRGSLAEDLEGEQNQDDAELFKYEPMESADLTKLGQGGGPPEALLGEDTLGSAPKQSTEEETTPLVSSNVDTKPCQGEESPKSLLDENSLDSVPKQIQGTKEETTPFVNSNFDTKPGQGEGLPKSLLGEDHLDSVPKQSIEEKTTPLVNSNVDTTPSRGEKEL